MHKAIHIVLIITQIIATFVVCICIYMLFALLDNNFGIDGLMGLFVFQPLLAIIISILTIFICITFGLPIRLNKKLNQWWTVHFYIAIIGFIIGLIALILSLLPVFTVTVLVDNELQFYKQTPNTILVSLVWFLTAFSLLHLYPPNRVINNFYKYFTR